MIKLTNFVYDELNIGDHAELTRMITKEDIYAFGKLSGDINPAHFDEEYAKDTIFKQVIAHGMLSGILISNILGTKFPGPGTIYLEQNLKFSKPVYVNDTINVKLVIIEKREKNRVVLDCKCTNQNNEVVISGVAIVLAPIKKLSIMAPIL